MARGRKEYPEIRWGDIYHLADWREKQSGIVKNEAGFREIKRHYRDSSNVTQQPRPSQLGALNSAALSVSHYLTGGHMVVLERQLSRLALR